jgi:hypothetical protein
MVKRLPILLSLLVALAGATLGQNADPVARAAEIINQARAAIGDEAKLKGLQSLTAAGTSRRVFGEREITSEITLELLLPDKIKRTSVSAPFPGAEFTVVEAINGDQVWTDFNSTMPAGPGGPGGPGGGMGRFGGMGGGGGGNEANRQLQLKAELTRTLLGILLAAPAGVPVEYKWIGEAKAPDGSADVIEVKGPGDSVSRLFIDQQTHRILMLGYRGKNLQGVMRGRGGQGGPGGGGGQPPSPEEQEKRRREIQEAIAKAPDVDFFWRFSDYKAFNGLTLPTRLTKATGDQLNEEWEIKYKINPGLKPDKFEKKEKK